MAREGRRGRRDRRRRRHVDGGVARAVRRPDRQARLGRHIPNLESAILARTVLSPADLERANVNLRHGDPYAGSLALDQNFLWRPFPAPRSRDRRRPPLAHRGEHPSRPRPRRRLRHAGRAGSCSSLCRCASSRVSILRAAVPRALVSAMRVARDTLFPHALRSISIYSEIQHWPGKTSRAAVRRRSLGAGRQRRPAGLRRLRRHRALLLPEVLDLGRSRSRSSRRAAPADEADQLPHAACTCCPTTTRSILASQIAQSPTSSSTGRYEFGVGRGHGWIPPKAGVPARRDSATATRRRSRSCSRRSSNERFSYDGQFFKLKDSDIVPRPTRSASASSSAARATGRTSSRPSAAGPWSFRRCCRTRCSRSRSTSTATTCAEHGHEPGHRLDPRVLHRRGPRHGAARGPAPHEGVPRGERLAAHRVRACRPPRS